MTPVNPTTPVTTTTNTKTKTVFQKAPFRVVKVRTFTVLAALLLIEGVMIGKVLSRTGGAKEPTAKTGATAVQGKKDENCNAIINTFAKRDCWVRKVKAGEKNLKGAFLYRVDLKDADLKDADLQGADMTRAYLRGANLRGANLSGANLIEAYLSGANLSGANLLRAYLKEANLFEAKLIKANLKEANLQDANLGEADLSEADLKDTELGGVSLRTTKVTGEQLAVARLIKL
jgi:uncharacterized protein YjbI with pentapeptide repeats